MNDSLLRSIIRLILAAGVVALVCYFWKPILWFILIIVGIFVVWLIAILFRANKIKKEIDKSPEEYFAQQEKQFEQPEEQNSDSAVIDAEYSERVVEEIKK